MQSSQGHLVSEEDAGMQRKCPYQRHWQPPEKDTDPLSLVGLFSAIPDGRIHSRQGTLHSALQHIDAIEGWKPLESPGNATGKEEEVGREGGRGGPLPGAGGGGVVEFLESADGEFVLV